jgi:DNA repair protein RadC
VKRLATPGRPETEAEMKTASATIVPQPSQISLAKRHPDREVLASDTRDLVRRLVGDDAAAALASHGSLWRLLAERTAMKLPWFEAERLDALAELVRRFSHEPPTLEAQGIADPVEAARLFSHLTLLDHEELWVALLSNKNIPLAVVRVGIGSVNSVIAFPSRVFREAMAWNASGILLAHNHPSGDPTPSSADKDFTRRIEEGALLVGVRVVDSLIMGSEGRVYSFSRRAELRVE